MAGDSRHWPGSVQKHFAKSSILEASRRREDWEWYLSEANEFCAQFESELIRARTGEGHRWLRGTACRARSLFPDLGQDRQIGRQRHDRGVIERDLVDKVFGYAFGAPNPQRAPLHVGPGHRWIK
jgi:hypothetical protein